MTVLLLLIAFKVETDDVPPIVRLEPADWIKSPVPLRAVLTVTLLLLISVTPVTVRLGMASVPVNDCVLVSKV